MINNRAIAVDSACILNRKKLLYIITFKHFDSAFIY